MIVIKILYNSRSARNSQSSTRGYTPSLSGNGCDEEGQILLIESNLECLHFRGVRTTDKVKDSGRTCYAHFPCSVSFSLTLVSRS